MSVLSVPRPDLLARETVKELFFGVTYEVVFSQMKWFSPKSNPAAHYLPSIFSEEEQLFAYRLLNSAATKTDNRATSTGAIIIGGKTAFVSPEQEAILDTLKSLTDELTIQQRLSALQIAIENYRGLKPNKAYKWVDGKSLNQVEFDTWWRSTAKLALDKRILAVNKFHLNHFSSRKYGMPALSGTIGFFGRDPNNNWARECSWNKNNHFLFQRVLPLIRRIDAAFREALPDRYRLQKEFVEKLDPRFVVKDTCFTTITVNKNYRTAAHRDAGDLSQGFSNISVFSNGRKFSGGHLVLPEFNVEVCLKPGDLLFVANHEYIHQNTAIQNDDPESERLSLVCYAREDLAFAGTLEFEQLRSEFVLKNKKFTRMWESKKWFDFLRTKLGEGKTLIEQSRSVGCLNNEILLLSNRYENETLFDSEKWEFIGELKLSNQSDFETLKALFSAVHFKSPRQDRWIRDNDEDGPTEVDAVYIGTDGWCFSYCESESGAVKFSNNRFNVNSVGKLSNFNLPKLNRISRDVFNWLSKQWGMLNLDHPVVVNLIRVPTNIPESPYRVAFTTLTQKEAVIASKAVKNASKNIIELCNLRTNPTYRSEFYESGGGIALRDTYKNLPQTDWLCDLGSEQVEKLQGKLENEKNNKPTVCESITIRSQGETAYLETQLTHWRKRALNYGSADYKSRYERVGTYQPPVKPIDRSLAGKPHHWNVTPDQIHLRRYGWAGNKRNTDKKVRGKTINHFMLSKVGLTNHSWKSKFQSALICSAQVPPSAYLSIWTHKVSIAETGQAVLTNGDTFWLFQSLSTLTPIRSSDRIEKETIKITKPTILGHLQLSALYQKEDVSSLTKKLKSRAEFIPTPFSEMSPIRLKDYKSSYRLGRVNVLAIGGPPASGKTSIMKQIFALSNDWSEQIQPVKLLDGYFSKKLNTWIFGVYDESVGIFQGTDKLSKAVPPQLVKFIRENADKPINILFEGANVVTSKTLVEIIDCDVNFALLRLMVSKSLKQTRHKNRGDTQNEQFIKSKETQIENVASNPKIFDFVIEVRNENSQNQETILKMINWFLRRSVKKKPNSIAKVRQKSRVIL